MYLFGKIKYSINILMTIGIRLRFVLICASLWLSLPASAQSSLTNGLVAYYPFNGDANDASGFGNNPVTNTATLVPDRNGNPNSAYFSMVPKTSSSRTCL